MECGTFIGETIDFTGEMDVPTKIRGGINMERGKWKKMKFYAVIREDKIGIFTDWKVVNKAICGHANKQKRFTDYFKALSFIRENLSEGVIKAYGIEEKNMKWNKWYFKLPY